MAVCWCRRRGGALWSSIRRGMTTLAMWRWPDVEPGSPRLLLLLGGRAVLQSQNQSYGFHGSMGETAEAAWGIALPLIMAATHCDEIEARDFLDSRYGRQFADTVLCYQDRGHTLEQAVAEAIAEWRGYRMGKATRRAYGIPDGADYLTGMVLTCVCRQRRA